jgi:hypothetical protein
MKHFLLTLPFLIAACGPKGADVSLTVSGVAMADLEPIRKELAALAGVGEVRAGQLKEGQATFTVTYAGKGGDLAAKLASTSLKNVKGFDDGSVQVAYGGAPAPSPVPAEAKKEEPKGGKKEIQVEVKKDPLAYKVHQLAGGTIATFDGWKVNPMPGDGTWTVMETHPDGKENDFQMIVSAGTPGPQVMANLFEEARKYLSQMMPGLRPVGDSQKTLIGGDDARVQDYSVVWQGRTLKVQSVIIRKKDVAVSVLALGADDAFKEFGRAVGITAQSITIKEEPPDPALVGTWLLEKYYSSGAGTSSQFSHSSSTSMTLYPNGTFSESSSSSSSLNNNVGNTSAYLDGGNRGKVVKRGTTLSFTYDNGKVWNADYKLDGGALVLNGNYWMRQR